MLPRGHKTFFALAGLAMAAAAIGDWANLLQFDGRFFYVANAAAWPVTITLLAFGCLAAAATVKNPSTEWIGGFGLPIFGTLTSVCLFFLASFGPRVEARPSPGHRRPCVAAGVRTGLAAREAHAQENGTFPRPDRQDVGPHRGRRGRSPGRLRLRVVERGAGPFAGRPREPTAHEHRAPRGFGLGGLEPAAPVERRRRSRDVRGAHAARRRDMANHLLDGRQPARGPLGQRLRAERLRRDRGAPGAEDLARPATLR